MLGLVPNTTITKTKQNKNEQEDLPWKLPLVVNGTLARGLYWQSLALRKSSDNAQRTKDPFVSSFLFFHIFASWII